MAGRPRCANCGKAFTPHPRNRSRTENRQRVCAECGPVIGHRLAVRRYQASRAGPRQRVCREQGAAPHASAGDVTERVAGAPGAVGGVVAVELAGHVGEHLAAIAALVGRACALSAPGASRAALDQHQSEFDSENRLMASGPSGRSPSASALQVDGAGLMASGGQTRS